MLVAILVAWLVVLPLTILGTVSIASWCRSRQTTDLAPVIELWPSVRRSSIQHGSRQRPRKTLRTEHRTARAHS